MLLPDVNVLVYAHRRDAPDHERYLAWLEQVVNSDEAYGLADLVL
jgi:predicted nucleic acid-binding protein